MNVKNRKGRNIKDFTDDVIATKLSRKLQFTTI